MPRGGRSDFRAGCVVSVSKRHHARVAWQRGLWIAPYCDPPKQASSAENACLIPFAGLPGSRTQSTSGCRALAARVDDAVLTAWFSPAWSRHRLGVCVSLLITGPLWPLAERDLLSRLPSSWRPTWRASCPPRPVYPLRYPRLPSSPLKDRSQPLRWRQSAHEPPPRLLSWSSNGMHANEIHDARRLEIFGRRVIRVYCMAFRIFRRIASLTSLSGSMIISLA